ncbi:MAG: hypothetical protein M9904_01725 [Chitinophagaceae bacterium]|nr:hypothetical protein [Chitinophagaceae bacterium]
MSRRLIFDAHLDLAMNAMEWNRDLTRSLVAIRQGEMHLKDKNDRGKGTVCLPELRKWEDRTGGGYPTVTCKCCRKRPPGIELELAPAGMGNDPGSACLVQERRHWVKWCRS